MAYFTVNNKYNVWEKKGLRLDNSGRLAISESDFSQGEVTQEMELTYLGKKVEGFEGVHCCLLPDGRQVVAHRNHFDSTTAYSQNKIARKAAQVEGATSEDTPEAA